MLLQFLESPVGGDRLIPASLGSQSGWEDPAHCPQTLHLPPCGTRWLMKSPQTSGSLGSSKCPACLVPVAGREGPMTQHPQAEKPGENTPTLPSSWQ